MTAAEAGLVATVAGQPIPIARLEDRLAALRRGPLGRHMPPDGAGENERLRRWVAQELVTRGVLVHEARQSGLIPDTEPEGTTELPAGVVEALFERVTAHVDVPDDELRDYYARNADLYHRAETRQMRYAIASSASVARAALDAPDIDDPAVRRGELPSVRRGELVGPLEDACFASPVGEIVGPLAFESGWMVARVEAIRPEATTPFEAVRDAIAAELLGAARAREFDDWIGSRVAALAALQPAYEHPGHPVHGLPNHRH